MISGSPFLAALGLLSCHRGTDLPPGTLVASDLRGGRWFTADLQTGDELDEFFLSDLEPEVCGPEETDRYCLLFQSRLRTAFDGRPEVLFTYSPLDVSDKSDTEREDLVGRYISVDAETHQKRWSFQYLDFSGLGGNPWCPFDPKDPCHPPEVLSDTAYHNCRLHMPHDMIVAGEDADHADLWVADTNNFRILSLTVPRSGDCAVVNEVLDAENPDWDIYLADNSMETWEDDGSLYLLMTIKGSNAYNDAGVAQQAGEGKGKVVLWRRDGTGWSQVWEFPPQSTTEASFINTPHGVARSLRSDGSEWILYAHSLGMSTGWGSGTGGSIGVLEIVDGQPVYRFDALVGGSDSLHFPRDVHPLSDGTFLVTDSGCLGDDCTWPTQAWVVDLDDLGGGNGDGVWTANHSRLNRQEATVLAGPLLTQADMLYSVEWEEKP